MLHNSDKKSGDMKNEEESMKLVKEEGFRSLFNQTFSKFDAKKEVYTAKGKAKYGIAHKAR